MTPNRRAIRTGPRLRSVALGLLVSAAWGTSILASSGCGDAGGKAAPSAAAVSASSTASAPAGSASATVSAPPEGSAAGSAAPPDVGPPNAAAVGNGIDTFEGLEGCAPQSVTAAEYLQRGELTIAGRPKQFGLAWLVQLKGRAQIGFGGFDEQAKQIARPRGVASAREHAPRIFPTGEDWTLAWFDDEGLAYARPRFALAPGVDVDHLSSVKETAPEDVALAVAPDGSLLAASTFGAGGQLSLFLFAPVDGAAPKAKALGLTKHAKGPRRPAAAADATGYTIAWLETDGSIAATRFDREGREVRPSSTVVSGVGERSGLALATIEQGTLLVWTESGEVRSRALSAEAQPIAPVHRVGRGQWATAASHGKDALVAWVGEAGGQPHQVVAARVGVGGPAKKGRRVTSSGAAEAPAVVAVAGDRAGFAWPEKMSSSIQSYRAVLRTVDAACFE